MLIQEEYARRHGLNMALVSHTLSEGLAILRAINDDSLVGGFRHILMTVRWVPHDRRPGIYQLFFQRPVHNSHASRSQFTFIQDASTVSYEDFDRMLRAIKEDSLGSYSAIMDDMSIDLFFWEMFVCCYDSWLLRNANGRMMEHIEASLDPALSLASRHENFDAAISTMAYEHTGVYEKWTTSFVSQRKKIAPWLGKMINGE